ncbi:hypothetical protein [Bradyrhizobium sp. Tv2a-2]|uniref:hypothetical protein n=1 Tax=Bradyrhizobium sp. Tv2a-2 TaxID=113395 RepID=UPI000467E01E|nr:hypothetical protein [Bradyrhizobium sp. Tv2a-2]
MLDQHHLPRGEAIIIFVAPPWGAALDEVEGLDLRRIEPQITEIIARVGQAYPDRQILFAIQVYEKVNAESLTEGRTRLDWSMLKNLRLRCCGAKSRHSARNQRVDTLTSSSKAV